MSDPYLLMALTALVSSSLTILGAVLYYTFYLDKHLDRKLEAAAALIEQKVRSGVQEAGRGLLPEVRKEVAEGFKDAMASAMGGELVDRTARVVAKSSTSFVEESLNLLLGKPKDKRE